MHRNLINRYRAYYSMARTMQRIATLVMVLGVMAALFALLLMVVGSPSHTSGQPFHGAFPSVFVLVAGASYVLSGYILGTVIECLGFALAAATDSAINTSTTLTDEEKFELTGDPATDGNVPNPHEEPETVPTTPCPLCGEPVQRGAFFCAACGRQFPPVNTQP